MLGQHPTSPSRARTIPHGQNSAETRNVPARPAAPAAGGPGNKWRIFQTIKAAHAQLGVPSRSLIVLEALLSFHPATDLAAAAQLVVFPSNEKLSDRAHGMPASTLRRHLAALIEAGLIARQDSPNGKRYARVGQGGAVERAFGFDLKPLLARAPEFARLAAELTRTKAEIASLREEISIARRAISKAIDAGRQNSLPGDWDSIEADYRSAVEHLPRATKKGQCPVELRNLVSEVSAILDRATKASEQHPAEIPGANESRIERHKESKHPSEFIEIRFEEKIDSRSLPAASKTTAPALPRARFDLADVLNACPEISIYSAQGISTWQDLTTLADTLAAALGIAPKTWAEVNRLLDRRRAAAVLAFIVELGPVIKSPGGYLNSLIQQARVGQLDINHLLQTAHRHSRKPLDPPAAAAAPPVESPIRVSAAALSRLGFQSNSHPDFERSTYETDFPVLSPTITTRPGLAGRQR